MKKTIFTIALVIPTVFISIAQDTINSTTKPSVEKSIYSVQTGLLGFWASNECKLSNRVALRSEIGFQTAILYSTSAQIRLLPEVTLATRFYHNLNKRFEKGKNISNNAANFLSLSLKFSQGNTYTNNTSSIETFSSISIIPTYGIKRNVGKHFNYELGAGIGYGYYFKPGYFFNNAQGLAYDIHIRFGYNFKNNK